MIKPTDFERVALPGEDKLPSGWFAVSHLWVVDTTERRRSRNHWYRLRSSYGTIYRVLRFAPTLKVGGHQEPGQLAVDYQGWWELQGLAVPEQDRLEVAIDRCGPLGALVGMCRHPDPTHRVASWLALISLGLGILSLILSFC